MADSKETKPAPATTPAASSDDTPPVGGQDPQNPDGAPRTERPGELLGTPAETPESTEQADHVAKAVDNANRYALPKLGGEQPDDWEADSADLENAKKTPADNAEA